MKVVKKSDDKEEKDVLHNYNYRKSERDQRFNSIMSIEHLFNIWALVCLVKLKSITYRRGDDLITVRKVLITDNSINLFKIIKTNYKSRKTFILKWIISKLIQISILIFTIDLFMKQVVTLLVHYKRDILVTGWKPKFFIIINNQTMKKSNLCLSSSRYEIHFEFKEDEMRFQKIIETTLSFENTYDLTLLSIGNPLLLYTIHLIVPLAHFYSGLIFLWSWKEGNTNYDNDNDNKNKSMKSDFYAFLFKPDVERLKFKDKIDYIFDNIISSLYHTIQYSKLRFDCPENKHESLYLKKKRSLDNNLNKNKSTFKEQNKNSYLSLRHNGINRFNEQQEDVTKLSPAGQELDTDIVRFNYITIYTELLVNLKIFNQVDAKNLSHYWHKRFCKLFKRYLIACSIIMYMTALIFNSGIQLVDIDKCLRIRFNHYRSCLIYNDEQKTIYDIINFKIIHNFEDEKTYLSNDIINLGYMELFLIELKFYFNRNDMILKTICLQINGFFSSIWIAFYTALHLFSHLDKLIWINGIQKDLNDCIKSLKELNASPKEDKHLGAHESEFNINLYRSICSVYVNYELFRKEHYKFLQIITMLVRQSTITCFLCMFSVYIIGSSVKTDSNILLLFMLTYVIGYVNCVFLLSAILTNKLKMFILSVTKMLAEVRSIKLRFCHIFDLWQRELMTPREIENFYAPSVLGIHLTIHTVAKMNYYLVFLWLLVLKNSYDNKYSEI